MLLKKVDSKEFDAVTLAWVSGRMLDFRQIWHSEQADNHNHPIMSLSETKKPMKSLKLSK